MTANQGARRLRACILGVIPGDLVEAAVQECERTLNKQNKEPLIDRVRKMIQPFEEIGVTPAMIEKRIRKKLEAITEAEFHQLRKIYRSIRDGMAAKESYFEPTAEAPQGLANDEVPMDFPTSKANSIAPTTPPPKKSAEKRATKEHAPASPTETIRGLMVTDEISEAELIELGVRKGWFEPVASVGALTLDALNKLIAEWDFATAQIRIDRKAQ
jgi:hypothetical protein